MMNQKQTDSLALLTTVNPSSQVAGAATSAWFPVKNFHSFLALIATGVLGASATVDAKIQQAQDSTGTGAKDIAGKAITQLVKASNDNSQAMINFKATDVDTANSFTHVALVITVGTATSITAGALFGCDSRYGPPVDSAASPAINLGATTVAQII